MGDERVVEVRVTGPAGEVRRLFGLDRPSEGDVLENLRRSWNDLPQAAEWWPADFFADLDERIEAARKQEEEE